MIKGQLLVTTTAIMVDLSLIEHERDFFERVVTVLYSVISNVNGALDRYTRQMVGTPRLPSHPARHRPLAMSPCPHTVAAPPQACECLRELEMAYPCLLEGYVADLLPGCRVGPTPSLSLFTCCETERSHNAQSYMQLALSALDHAATRLTQDEPGCALTDALSRINTAGAPPAPTPVVAPAAAEGSALSPQEQEGEKTSPHSAPAPLGTDADSSGQAATAPEGGDAAEAAPAGERDASSGGDPFPAAQGAPLYIPFDVQTPCQAERFYLPPPTSLPLPVPAYQAHWPRVMWRCDRVEAWRTAATTRGTALPPAAIDRVTRALSMVLDGAALYGSWAKASMVAKAVPFAHTAGVPDPVFRHHLLRLMHFDSPLMLHATVLVHSALMSALSSADEQALVRRVAGTARDPVVSEPLRLLALHWLRAFPAKAAREAVGQASPFALLHASIPSLLPHVFDPVSVRLATLAALLEAYHPDPRVPCAPPPALLRGLDCLREMRYQDPAAPLATAAFALLHTAMIRFPQLCHGARAWLHDLVAHAPRFAGHAVHLINLLLAAEPPPSSYPRRGPAAAEGAALGGQEKGPDATASDDGHADADALAPLAPRVFGSTVTRAVGLFLLASFVPLLASLRPRRRLVPLLPLLRRVVAARDLDPGELLHALADVAADTDTMLDRDWMLGQRVLDIARTAMLTHPAPLVWGPLSRLFTDLTRCHGDVDVRDRAAHYALLLEHLGGARLARVLRGDGLRPVSGTADADADRGSGIGDSDTLAGSDRAAPGGVGPGGDVPTDGAAPVAEVQLAPLLKLQPMRRARRRMGIQDRASADLITSRLATLQARRAEEGFCAEQRPCTPTRGKGPSPALPPSCAPSDAGADGTTVGEAALLLAEDVHDALAAAAAAPRSLLPLLGPGAAGRAEAPAPGIVRELLLAGAAAAAAVSQEEDQEGKGVVRGVQEVLWALYASAVAVGATPDTVHLPLALRCVGEGPSGAESASRSSAPGLASPAWSEGARTPRHGAAPAKTPSSKGLYALTLTTSLSPDYHPVRPICLPFLVPCPPGAPSSVQRTFPHAFELVLAVRPRVAVPAAFSTRCVFSDFRGTAKAGALAPVRVKFADLLQPLPVFALGASVVRQVRRAVLTALLARHASAAAHPPAEGDVEAALGAWQRGNEAGADDAGPTVAAATACAQSLLFDALWEHVVEGGDGGDGAHWARGADAVRGAVDTARAVRGSDAAVWLEGKGVDEVMGAASPPRRGPAPARGGCECVRLLRQPRGRVLALVEERLGPFLIASRRAVCAALLAAAGVDGGAETEASFEAGDAVGMDDAEELWYQRHLQASDPGEEEVRLVGEGAPAADSNAARGPTPHYDDVEARLTDARRAAEGGAERSAAATAAERAALGLPEHARMVGGRLVSRVQVLRVGIYMPPGHHLLLQFCISESSTLVRVRTDRWQLVAEADRFLAALDQRPAGDGGEHAPAV